MSEQRAGLRQIPIPVVVVGPGSQPEEDTLDYMVMPRGMDTYVPPSMPEPEQMAGHEAVLGVLGDIVRALEARLSGQPAAPISLDDLHAEDRALVNQILGEGEVGVQVAPEAGRGAVRVQESIFAGVWRVVRADADGRVHDCVEIGAIPAIVPESARAGASGPDVALDVPEAPPGVMNAPSILSEIADARRAAQPGQDAHVVNLTLLPLSPDDIGFMDHVLGTGPVTILSRGYGNCRITSTRTGNVWRVVYYNSQDVVILNSVEVVDVPEVACAAEEDLRDSVERLREVMAWMHAS